MSRGDHAPLAPSSADRWSECSASVSFEARYPEREDSPSAIEGTQAHAVMSTMLTAQPTPDYATDEMLEGAAMMFQRAMQHWEAGRNIVIEQPVKIESIHKDCWGTPDFYVIDQAAKRLWVEDYKFGHRYVPPTTRQLVCYAAGALESVGESGIGWEINLTVVQPRNYHPSGPVRTLTMTGEQLGREVTFLQHAAKMVYEAPSTRINDQCSNCRARHACPSQALAAAYSMDVASFTTPLDMPVEGMARELMTLERAGDILKARASGIREELTYRAKKGEAVRNWMLEQGGGRLGWNKSADEVYALGQMFGVELAGIGWIKTPTQAIKLGVPEAVVNSYSERKQGEIKLVPDDGSKAQRIFGASNV